MTNFAGMQRTLPTLQAYSFAVDVELRTHVDLRSRKVAPPYHPFMSDSDVEQVVAVGNSLGEIADLMDSIVIPVYNDEVSHRVRHAIGLRGIL
jgi:hypothetical protein